MGQWSFHDELELEEINVPRAALQFARAIAYPDLDIAAYMAMLHDISEVAADYVDLAQPILNQAQQLSAFLFGVFGFRGNSDRYDDPRNSYLNEVLERRLGIPITLSAIYVDIATRLGIPAYGISLPGHFIVGVHERDAEIWLDPFHDGRRLDLTDCAGLIKMSTGFEGPLEASWFAPSAARDILARMLANLRASYVSTSSWHQAAAVIQLLRQTQPQEAEHLRDLGLVYYHQGRLSKAAHYLNAYLHQVPDAADAEVIRAGMKHLLDEWVPMN
jgi:regulator of sirC expression with transglutaminase-like and TPR domain